MNKVASYISYSDFLSNRISLRASHSNFCSSVFSSFSIPRAKRRRPDQILVTYNFNFDVCACVCVCARARAHTHTHVLNKRFLFSLAWKNTGVFFISEYARNVYEKLGVLIRLARGCRMCCIACYLDEKSLLLCRAAERMGGTTCKPVNNELQKKNERRKSCSRI